MKRLTHMELAAAYDRQDWGLLWEHALPLAKLTVGRVVRAKTINGADMDDVLQQAYLVAWRAVKDWPVVECSFSTHIMNRARWGLLEFLGGAGNHGIGSHVQRSVVLSLEDSRDANGYKRGPALEVDNEDEADDGSFNDALTYGGVIRLAGQLDGCGFVPRGFGDPSEEAGALQAAEVIHGALRRLNKEEREALCCVYGVGCAVETQEQYAHRVRKPIRSITRILAAAKKKMARNIERSRHMNHGRQEHVRDTQ